MCSALMGNEEKKFDSFYLHNNEITVDNKEKRFKNYAKVFNIVNFKLIFYELLWILEKRFRSIVLNVPCLKQRYNANQVLITGLKGLAHSVKHFVKPTLKICIC